MHLALPREAELTRGDVRAEGERAILVHQPRHGGGQLHIVGAVLRLHGERIDGGTRDFWRG